MDVNKLINLLNKLTNTSGLETKTINLSNKLVETLKIIENCTACKHMRKEYYFDILFYSINEIECRLVKLEEEKEEWKKNSIINKLNDELTEIDDELNEKVLCDDCKEKKIENLINECGNEEMARLLYGCKLNSRITTYIQWIPFNEFGNIEYLAKGGFGEVSKATWIGHYDYYGMYGEYKERKVVLKRIYNSSNNILDILKEVNKKKA